MKIAVYDVREDEREDLKMMEEKYNCQLVLITSSLDENSLMFSTGCVGVSVLGHSQINKKMIDLLIANNINYLTTRTIGVNNIDVEYAKEKGLHVANSTYDPNGVADYTVMFMLMVLRNYKQALWRGQVYDFSLKGLQGREMRSMTVGVLGTGRIGKTVIKNLSGFGCKMYAYDLYKNKEVEQYATYTDLETIYKECDIITLHMPLVKDNFHLINHETIAKMKDGVVLINCARGELMDIDALIDGLESCKIGALGLDTVETEEDVMHLDRRFDIVANRRIAYIRQFPNVVMTQHMAFYTKEAVRSMVDYGVLGIIEMASNHDYINEI